METFTVIIETPKGKGHKFDFDPASGFFKLNKVMPAGLVFPFDFGFLPGTAGGDGDPLDVMVVSEIETFTGCAIDCRMIGVIKAEQTERDGKQMRNDRLIAVPVVSQQYGAVDKLSQLPGDILSQIENFFVNYNLQAGKQFEVQQRVGPREAHKVIESARRQDRQTLLIQLLVPVYDSEGKRFPARYYSQLQRKLTDKFGGLTIYSRNPAEGFWKEGKSQTVKEEMLVCEVMAVEADPDFWQKLKLTLVEQFDQEEIVITSCKISRI